MCKVSQATWRESQVLDSTKDET